MECARPPKLCRKDRIFENRSRDSFSLSALDFDATGDFGFLDFFFLLPPVYTSFPLNSSKSAINDSPSSSRRRPGNDPRGGSLRILVFNHRTRKSDVMFVSFVGYFRYVSTFVPVYNVVLRK